MTTTSSSITFKLHLAPGAVEEISIQYSDLKNLIEQLELKIGELGLTFDVIYWKNEKRNLICLGQNVQKIRKLLKSSKPVSIYAIADSSSDSSDSSDSSGDDSDGEEIIVVEEATDVPRRHGCRRNRSRSRGFDRSRSRSHSRSHSRGQRKERKCGFRRFGGPSDIRSFWNRGFGGHGPDADFRRRHCFGGRRARSVSPGAQRPFEAGFGRRGPHGHFSHGPHHHPFGPFGRRGGFGHHGFGHHGFGGPHHGFGHSHGPESGFGRHHQHPFDFRGFGRFGPC